MKRFLVLPAFILLIAVSNLILGQSNGQTTKRTMTFEDVLSLKYVSDAQISPDGRWVAYVVISDDIKENATDADIWMVSVSGGDPVRLTQIRRTTTSPGGHRTANTSHLYPPAKNDRRYL
jgi:Uncharacterized protein related to the periplasmic component of the Tol biopolymer transport system